MLPAEVTAYFLKHQDLRLRLEFQIVCQCAPFLKGMKASSLIALEEGLCLGIREFFEGTQVRWRIFKGKRGKALVLLYRKEELEEYVNRPGIRRILGRRCGWIYPDRRPAVSGSRLLEGLSGYYVCCKDISEL